ncbi:Rrp15p-domain-containing protein [Zychaea mexicana]|uniref:Rrp15p-domain-containing protein n=1 Tax=Zychaea mexicana TaxID=64656 RepID=UPI0022FE3794|nr:Rrp15p-domain-containing protein [Zychaea mexicana]KAI9494374.1 Rrp15p-domain-containing protein [Zychaea mexicana]
MAKDTKKLKKQEEFSEEDEDQFDESDLDLEADDEDDDDDLDSNDDPMEQDDEFDLDQEQKSSNAKGKNSSEAFSEAMTKILASSLKGSDKKQPIMARSKGTERKIEDEKLEYKARKMMTAEKKAQKERGRVIPDYTSFDYEKRLRKVATRGVVKLFNAIRTQQKATEVAVTKVSEKHKASSAIEKARNVSTMSKSNFLDLLKTGSS